MRSIAAGLALAFAAGAAAAQGDPRPSVDHVMGQASICAAAPNAAAIAARAAEWGWRETPRKDALRMQAVPDKTALIRGWFVGSAEAPTYLLVETPNTPLPRRLTCEVVFQTADPLAVEAAMGERGFGAPLGAPTLTGPFPAGGRFSEWQAPPETGWRLITLSLPARPRKGPPLNRIRFSGVER